MIIITYLLGTLQHKISIRNLNEDISKLVRNILGTRDLEGMTNDLEVISIPKKASKFHFTNPLRRPHYEA
jgi:hypothetical protein